MSPHTLSESAYKVIDQYLHFTYGSAICSVPYFNNKTTRSRGAFRAHIGKGSPQDISDELRSILIKTHTLDTQLTSQSLKKILTDANLGIDCSGFVYHVLSAEYTARNRGTLSTHLVFVARRGLFGAVRARMRPAENCDVATFAHDKNSMPVALNGIEAGDIITIRSNDAKIDRDHILLIHRVEYRESTPATIHYSHAVAYPEDGVYGTGIKQGTIEILDSNTPITEQLWTEDTMQGDNNRTLLRARHAHTEVRRLLGIK